MVTAPFCFSHAWYMCGIMLTKDFRRSQRPKLLFVQRPKSVVGTGVGNCLLHSGLWLRVANGCMVRGRLVCERYGMVPLKVCFGLAFAAL